MLFCELLSPVIELVSFIFIVIGLYLGFVTPQVFAAIVLVIVGISLILSMTTLLLEEMSYHLYSKPSEVIRLVLAIVLENIGYRQITLYWRIIGLLHWMFGRREYRWPDITRRGVVRVTP